MEDLSGSFSNTNDLNSGDQQQQLSGSQQGSQQQLSGSQQGSQQGSTNNIDSMLAGSDDDDLFQPPPQQPQTQEEEEVEDTSALDKWREEKQNELRELDQKESEQNSEMSKKARESLDGFNKKLEESQASRAKHNLEVDEQFIQERDSTSTKPWERVVSYIDFNRADLHERDVQRMKSLLLQLKH